MNVLELFAGPGSFDAMIKVVLMLLKIAVVVGALMLHVTYATYFERKTIGHMQVRLGPMRTGFHGLLQPIADFVKLFFKEDIIPADADKPMFFIAPVIAVFAAMTSIAVIPFFEGFVIADINVGLLFVLAMSSLGSYGIIMAGWAANSKYSFLGALRSSAQVVSYEISLGLSLVGVMMLAGSFRLTDIVKAQEHYPLGMFLFPQIIGFFVFLLSAIAETNRPPFDLPEAESELVAGYFVEYSGMRFALFYVSEYIGMIIMGCIGTVCFLGGWHGPFEIPYLPFAWFLAKVYFIIFFYYWIRATLPRYRYDHLMSLGWKVLIPLALLNIVLTGIAKVLV
ncbi:MAG TPA: NADH-quinone oxidoreductase subunit NuoH [Thermodesulfovibrionales bacterium]|nr:NADH-quinone oxidoreductase subunit NuoH [Thermodesulfovibrionales bacterium]